jgi:hypothetical protein
MKTITLTTILAMLITPLAFAAEDHTSKGPNGGKVIESKAGFSFEVTVDKDASGLVSDKPLPTGDHVPMILTIKTNPDAKAVTERFELHLH